MGDVGDGPVVAEVGMVYWVETTILPPGDPEPRRPVVVLRVGEGASGTVVVVSRSTTDDYGVEHPAGGRLGFSNPGRFSRRLPALRQLWTGAEVIPFGPLDAAVFDAVVDRFAT